MADVLAAELNSWLWTEAGRLHWTPCTCLQALLGSRNLKLSGCLPCDAKFCCVYVLGLKEICI